MVQELPAYAETVPSVPARWSADFTPETVRLVEEAVPAYAVPETVTAVEEAYGYTTAVVSGAVRSEVPFQYTPLPEVVKEDALVPPLAMGKTPVTPVVRGRPVRLVATPDAGVPSAGVTRTAFVVRTTSPVPFHTKSDEVARKAGTADPLVLLARTLFATAVVPNVVALLPEDTTAPERFALVVTVAAFPVILMFTAVEVEIEATVFTPVAYTRPEAAASGLVVERPP